MGTTIRIRFGRRSLWTAFLFCYGIPDPRPGLTRDGATGSDEPTHTTPLLFLGRGRLGKRMDVNWQIIGTGVTVALAVSGGIAGLLKWSLGRNIDMLDQKIDMLLQRLEANEEKLNKLDREHVNRADCQSCRKDCVASNAAKWAEMVDWMRRVEDKFDRLLLAITANRGGN